MISIKSATRSRTQVLAMRNSSGELVAAASARCAVELGRRHHGNIPAAAIDEAVAQFDQWLRSACEAASAPPVRSEIGDEEAC